MDMWKCHAGQKQLPVPDEDSLVFWEACRRQRLVVQQCVACQHYRFPPSPLCPACLSPRLAWREDPGRGEVETFCVYHSELAGPAWQPDLPYVVAVIRLWHTGVQMLSQLRCTDPGAIAIGMVVQVRFEPASEQIMLPKFVPVAASQIPGQA
ncbi:Zn-ribbon domain-containing OB-fold protein [Candidatus Entotheonella palauensis]|uniref:DUF35 domain-containing protein n=1 Tax=Candidatus Entotheonella gemina TaxID=1429439 RepID=W4MCS0_9BACT|nr:OB-fold domain-containing protein [Candidatus Entotheonella palauensis]ETX08139.1 MAG: hypothetical protein ETSY2_07105 [Candidatus Entotheonella gemina]